MTTLHTHKSLKQRLLSGGAWSFISKGGASFLTIALAAVITRLLPPDDVGVFFLSYSIIVLLSFLARFGLDKFCVRYLGDEIAKHRYLAARKLVNIVILAVFSLSLVISLSLYFLFDIFILEHLLREDIGFSINLYLAIWLPVTAFQFLFAEIFRAYHNIKYASIFAGGTIFGGFLPSIIFGSIISLAFVTDGSFYLEEVLQLLFSIAVILLVIEYKIMRRMINEYCDQDGDKSDETLNLKEIFFNTYPFFIAALSFMALVHADTVVLGFFEQEAEVAIYNAATRVAKLTVILYMIINEVIMPVIVELNIKGEKNKLEEILRAASTLAVLTSVAVLLIFIFFGEYLMATVYGDFYKSGALLLIIMCIGQLISVFFGSGDIALNMMGYQKVDMYISLLTSIVAISACVVVAPLYGAAAVASVIAVAMVVRSATATFYVHKYTGIWVYANIFIGVSGFKQLLANVKR